MHMGISQEPLYGNLQETARPQSHDTRFVRACALEMHMTFHKNHCMDMYREILDVYESTSINQAVTLTVRL